MRTMEHEKRRNKWHILKVLLESAFLFCSLFCHGANEGAVDLLWQEAIELKKSGKDSIDRIKGQLFTMDLQAIDYRNNLVAEDKEENPGVILHWNIDDDDGSGTNLMQIVKRPGADYEQTNVEIKGEDDLKRLSVVITPIPKEGMISLSIGMNGRIWKNSQKGAGMLAVDAGQEGKWNLADASQRGDFINVVSDLYVEGINRGDADVVLKYQSPKMGMIFDKVRYHFFAADCGRQPTPSERLEIKGMFENLIDCEWSITDEATEAYNCYAWSAGFSDRQILPFLRDSNGTYIAKCMKKVTDTSTKLTLFESIDSYDVLDGVVTTSDIAAFYYTTRKLRICRENRTCKAIIYANSKGMAHAARDKECICGVNGIVFHESKCGDEGVRIEHKYEQLNGGFYGSAVLFYE